MHPPAGGHASHPHMSDKRSQLGRKLHALVDTKGLPIRVAVHSARASDRKACPRDGGDDDKAYRGALRNIQNHINAVGADNIDVKGVLHGNGVDLLKSAKTDQKLQSNVTSLKTQNASFNICNNTLKGRKISYENDLFEVFEDDIVSSGVAEVSRLQMMGYTYIKP